MPPNGLATLRFAQYSEAFASLHDNLQAWTYFVHEFFTDRAMYRVKTFLQSERQDFEQFINGNIGSNTGMGTANSKGNCALDGDDNNSNVDTDLHSGLDLGLNLDLAAQMNNGLNAIVSSDGSSSSTRPNSGPISGPSGTNVAHSLSSGPSTASTTGSTSGPAPGNGSASGPGSCTNFRLSEQQQMPGYRQKTCEMCASGLARVFYAMHLPLQDGNQLLKTQIFCEKSRDMQSPSEVNLLKNCHVTLLSHYLNGAVTIENGVVSIVFSHPPLLKIEYYSFIATGPCREYRPFPPKQLPVPVPIGEVGNGNAVAAAQMSMNENYVRVMEVNEILSYMQDIMTYSLARVMRPSAAMNYMAHLINSSERKMRINTTIPELELSGNDNDRRPLSANDAIRVKYENSETPSRPSSSFPEAAAQKMNNDGPMHRGWSGGQNKQPRAGIASDNGDSNQNGEKVSSDVLIWT